MSELEELIAERRRINERIKELKIGAKIYGRAKLDLDHFATSKADEWCISIERIIDNEAYYRSPLKRYSIIRSTDRSKCIEYIDEIINDLQGLKEISE